MRLSVCLLFSLFCAVGARCPEEEHDPESQSEPGLPLPLPSASATKTKTTKPASSDAEADPAREAARAEAKAAAEKAVIEIRNRKVSIGAPPLALRHIAFGNGFVVQVGEKDVVVSSSNDGRELARLTFKDPRAALALPAGSVLVVALDSSYRFDPGQRRPHSLPRIPLLPGFLLENGRSSSEFVWAVEPPPGGSVARVSFDPSLPLPIDREYPISDYDGKAFTVLSDGSFLYTNGRELVHRWPFGQPKSFAIPPEVGAVWRLAAADRIDHAWAATVEGDLVLLELRERARVIRTVRSGRVPFDFVATARRLALLTVDESSGPERQFSFSIYDVQGKELATRALDRVGATAEIDWVSRIAADHELSIGERPPRIAVGGIKAVRLFDSTTGEAVGVEPSQ